MESELKPFCSSHQTCVRSAAHAGALRALHIRAALRREADAKQAQMVQVISPARTAVMTRAIIVRTINSLGPTGKIEHIIHHHSFDRSSVMGVQLGSSALDVAAPSVSLLKPPSGPATTVGRAALHRAPESDANGGADAVAWQER